MRLSSSSRRRRVKQVFFLRALTFHNTLFFPASLKEKIQELTVEDKMLSMTEIKIKEEVKAMERELLEVGKLMVEESIVISTMIMIMILISMQVGRLMVEEEAVRREKIAGCNAAREMHEAQVVP